VHSLKEEEVSLGEVSHFFQFQELLLYLHGDLRCSIHSDADAYCSMALSICGKSKSC
jgi:hypothetical protein